MTVTVRPRTDADMQKCARLLVKVHQLDGYPVEGVADPIAWLTPATLVRAWVGELNDAVVGHVLVTTATESDDAANIWTQQTGEPVSQLLTFGRLFVGPDGRGHGVGEQLTREAMAYAKEQDRRLVLDVMEKDKAAIRLYERLGWQNIGAATHRFGDGQEVAAQCYITPS